MVVDELHLRALARNNQLFCRTQRREHALVGNIFPPVAEIFSSERVPVRPAMPLSQMQGKNPIVLDIDPTEDVGLNIEFRIVRHKTRIAIDDHDSRVFGAAEDHPHRAAVLARYFDLHDPRV